MSSWLNRPQPTFFMCVFPGFSMSPGDPHSLPPLQVPYLQALDQETLVAVARKLTPQLFAPNEAIEKQSAFGQVDWQ